MANPKQLEELSAYLDYDLEEALQTELEAALASDPELCSDLDQLGRALQLLRDQAYVPPHESLERDILEAIAQQEVEEAAPPVPWWRAASLGGVLLAVAAGMLMAILPQSEAPQFDTLERKAIFSAKRTVNDVLADATLERAGKRLHGMLDLRPGMPTPSEDLSASYLAELIQTYDSKWSLEAPPRGERETAQPTLSMTVPREQLREVQSNLYSIVQEGHIRFITVDASGNTAWSEISVVLEPTFQNTRDIIRFERWISKDSATWSPGPEPSDSPNAGQRRITLKVEPDDLDALLTDLNLLALIDKVTSLNVEEDPTSNLSSVTFYVQPGW